MSTRWFTTAAALGALMLAAPATAQEPDFHWQGRVAAGRTLEVIGLNGRIEATPASEGTAEVRAEKRRRGNVEDVTIDVIEHSGGVRVCAVYPTKDGGRTTCDEKGIHGRTGDNNASVDFTVLVPTGVRFVARTVNGKVRARSLKGDVRASTVNGGIEVDGTGTVEAHTVNGSIDAGIGSDRWDGTLAFETVNGSITVRLPDGAAARVEAKTVNGGLSSDFPLTVTPGKSWGPRRMQGTIGQGGGTLELETVNGAIQIRRS